MKIALDPQVRKNIRFYERANSLVSYQEHDEVIGEFLQAYLTELTEEAKAKKVFAGRKERSYPITQAESILLQHQSTAAQDLTISGFEGDVAEEILEDVSGYNVAYDEMFSDQLWNHFQFGHHGILVEGAEELSDNLQGARESGERSYQMLFDPRDIWRLKYHTSGIRKGEVSDVVLSTEPEVDGDKQYLTARRYISTSAGYEVYELRTKDTHSTTITKDQLGQGMEFEIVSQRDGGVSRIPFVPFGMGPQDSALRVVVPLDIALLNRLSILSNINFNQGFERIFAIGVRDDKDFDRIGEYVINNLPPGASVQSLAPGYPQSVFEEIKMIMHWAQRLGLLQYNQLMEDTRQVQSAESKAKDLAVRAKYYNDTLNRLERSLKQIYQLHAEYEGFNPDNIEVTIQRDFGLIDTELEFQKDAFLFSIVGDFGAAGFEVKKAIANKYLGELRLPAKEGIDEAAYRKELAEGIFNAPYEKAGLLSAPNRKLLSSSGDLAVFENQNANKNGNPTELPATATPPSAR